MRVLFLSVTAGQGHNQTAKAVMECLEERKIECNVLDTFEYINPVISQSISRGYLISTRLTPNVYGRFYRLAEKLDSKNARVSVRKTKNMSWGKKLRGYIRGYEPDAIVCTHPFAAQVISHVTVDNVSYTTYGIITDFTIHPFWADTSLDYYITANELLMREAVKKGIEKEKILSTGIPVGKRFATKKTKSEARAALGIEDKDTVLVMSGSMGYGDITKAIKQLDEVDLDFQILSVCGSNTHIKGKVDNLAIHKQVYNYGFVDNVDLMMDASDCIITKPGGLTVSESMAKQLPMILINPIPGQEERNVEFLLNNGLAIKVSTTFTIDMAIYHLLGDKVNIAALTERIKNVSRPNAAKALCDFMMEQ